MNVRRAILALLAISVVLSAGAGVANGDPPSAIGESQRASAEDNRPKAQSADRLEKMREMVRGVKLRSGDGDDHTILERSPEPLLRYADPPDNALEDATVWIWRRGQRPAAILKLEFYPRLEGRTIWSFCWTSVSNEPINGRFEDGKTWFAPSAKIEPEWLSEAPSPAVDAQQRLRQMRQIARRFTSYRVWGEENRTELRLLSRPLYRYRSEADGITDGAIFSIVKDTNPHVELLIEAALDDGMPRWRYSCVRHADAECHVLLDGREVWQAPRLAAVDSRQAYFWFQMPTAKQ